MMAIGKKWLIPEQKKLTMGDVLLDGLHILIVRQQNVALDCEWLMRMAAESNHWKPVWSVWHSRKSHMRVYSDDSIKDCSIHYNGYVLLVQVSVIDKISTMVANSSGSSVFILQSRGLSPQYPPTCTTLPTFGCVCTNIGSVMYAFVEISTFGLICTHQ